MASAGNLCTSVMIIFGPHWHSIKIAWGNILDVDAKTTKVERDWSS